MARRKECFSPSPGNAYARALMLNLNGAELGAGFLSISSAMGVPRTAEYA